MSPLDAAEAKLLGADAAIAVCIGPREFILNADEVFTLLSSAREQIADARAAIVAAQKGGRP